MELDLTSTRRHVGDVELQVVEAGPPDGPLVILLHGFPDTSWTWRHQIGTLAKQGYRVVAPDQRGYNLSDKPRGLAAYRLDALVEDVIGLANSYGRHSFRLVGHDWGGVVAYGVAVRHPDRIERLVAIACPHPDVWARQALRHPAQILRSLYVAFFQLPWVPEALLGAKKFALLRRTMTITSSPGVFSPDDLDRYADAWAQPAALTAMLNYYRALRLRPRHGSPGRLQPPTLIIWGGRDVFLAPHVVQAALDLCDQGSELPFDRATHWLHLEEAEAVSAALLRFFGNPVTNGPVPG